MVTTDLRFIRFSSDEALIATVVSEYNETFEKSNSYFIAEPEEVKLSFQHSIGTSFGRFPNAKTNLRMGQSGVLISSGCFCLRRLFCWVSSSIVYVIYIYNLLVDSTYLVFSYSLFDTQVFQTSYLNFSLVINYSCVTFIHVGVQAR